MPQLCKPMNISEIILKNKIYWLKAKYVKHRVNKNKKSVHSFSAPYIGV